MNVGDTVQVIGDDGPIGIVRKVMHDRWSKARGSMVTFERQDNGQVASLRSNLLRPVEKPLMQIAEPPTPIQRAADILAESATMAPTKDTSFLELSLDEAYLAVAAISGTSESDLKKRYVKLNIGMQKMNLVNRLRSHARKQTSK